LIARIPIQTWQFWRRRGTERKERGGGTVAPCKCTASTENISGVSQVPNVTAMPTLP